MQYEYKYLIILKPMKTNLLLLASAIILMLSALTAPIIIWSFVLQGLARAFISSYLLIKALW
jgi:hypothetical protein